MGKASSEDTAVHTNSSLSAWCVRCPLLLCTSVARIYEFHTDSERTGDLDTFSNVTTAMILLLVLYSSMIRYHKSACVQFILLYSLSRSYICKIIYRSVVTPVKSSKRPQDTPVTVLESTTNACLCLVLLQLLCGATALLTAHPSAMPFRLRWSCTSLRKEEAPAEKKERKQTNAIQCDAEPSNPDPEIKH